MFPAVRRGGCLNAAIIQVLGLTKSEDLNMMHTSFITFFNHCDTKKPGISNDPRLSFYSDVDFLKAYAL